MSEDLIRRSDVIKKIKWWFDLIKLNPDILIDSIITLPTIEPKRGKWIDDDEHVEYYWANCSVCGLQIDVHENRGYHNFCPNCGARMKGADDDSD